MSTADSISVLMNFHTSDVKSQTCISLDESAAEVFCLATKKHIYKKW